MKENEVNFIDIPFSQLNLEGEIEIVNLSEFSDVRFDVFEAETEIDPRLWISIDWNKETLQVPEKKEDRLYLAKELDRVSDLFMDVSYQQLKDWNLTPGDDEDYYGSYLAVFAQILRNTP